MVALARSGAEVTSATRLRPRRRPDGDWPGLRWRPGSGRGRVRARRGCAPGGRRSGRGGQGRLARRAMAGCHPAAGARPVSHPRIRRCACPREGTAHHRPDRRGDRAGRGEAGCDGRRALRRQAQATPWLPVATVQRQPVRRGTPIAGRHPTCTSSGGPSASTSPARTESRFGWRPAVCSRGRPSTKAPSRSGPGRMTWDAPAAGQDSAAAVVDGEHVVGTVGERVVELRQGVHTGEVNMPLFGQLLQRSRFLT